MSCSTCSNNTAGVPGGCKNNGSCGTGGCNKLSVFDWLANMQLPTGQKKYNILEVQFKNERKDYFKNEKSLPLTAGDIVCVQGASGHDVGVVTLTGELVKLQLNKRKIKDTKSLNVIYRKAGDGDIKKWHEARALEDEIKPKARKIAIELKLAMKISDVEYQGDKTKAVFYYTADNRVDFRELIKRFASDFSVRVEMKQIGMRQEAGKLGGIGSCGRELCCSTWLTDFRSVSTSAARYQQLSLNPQKLAGQCGKLKCCLNFELDGYMEQMKTFPDTRIELKTQSGNARHQKTDVFKRMMWYSVLDKNGLSTFIPLTAERANEVIAMNKAGEKPQSLKDFMVVETPLEEEKDNFGSVVGQDSLTRFDDKFKKKSKGKRKGGNNNNNRYKGKKKFSGDKNKPQNDNAK